MREIPVIQYQNVGDYPRKMMEVGLLAHKGLSIRRKYDEALIE